MAPDDSVGLFLGAGASFELGMPLVWHLTGEFKGYFTPDHVRELNVGWRLQGGGYDDTIIETTIALLQRDDLHYENILGALQTISRRNDEPFAEQYSEMYGRMVEIISLLLVHRQTKSLPYIVLGLAPFEGLANFVTASGRVWTFSLNHDLMIQLLAKHCDIPLRDGFWPDNQLIINGSPATVPLIADVLSEDDLNKGRLHLFERGEDGINLIRLHGALDVFTFRDGLDLCRLCPTTSELNGILKPLEILNEELAYWERGTKVRVVNEVAYADGTGALQFLRRTLLAGAQKFNQRFAQTLPHKMLDIFRNNIGHVTKLYCVGYSFGDAHVDAVLRLWLEQSGKRSLIIVSPERKDIPAQLAHLALQIQLKPQCASEFFADYRTSTLSPEQQTIQKIRAMNRDAIELKAAKKW